MSTSCDCRGKGAAGARHNNVRRHGIGHLWAMRPFRLFRGDRLDQARVTSYARSWTTECPFLRQLKALPPPCPSGDDGPPSVNACAGVSDRSQTTPKREGPSSPVPGPGPEPGCLGFLRLDYW